MRLLRWFGFTMIASLILSWLLWRDLLTSLPPPPPATTAFERHFGFGISPEITVLLTKPLPTSMILDGTFGDAVDRLRETTHANIFVNWRALENFRVTKQTPIQLDISNQPFGQALLSIFDLASPGSPRIECTVDEGVIVISTHDDLQKNTQTRVYDVRDLFSDIFSDPTGARRARAKVNPALPSQQEIVTFEKLVTAQIDPGSWRPNPGQVGAIKYLSGQLIITQSKLNQREIDGLLYQLRRRRRITSLALRSVTLAGSACLLVTFVYVCLARRFLARARRLAGLCAHCGYDVRASADRCPECGAPIDVKQSAAASPGIPV